jgi:hypothetical protein
MENDGMENVDFAAIGAALEQANQEAAQAQHKHHHHQEALLMIE